MVNKIINGGNVTENKLKVKKREDGLYYFVDENGNAVCEGFEYILDSNKNGIAIGIKDGLQYLINTKCEKVSEGFGYIGDFDKNGIAIGVKDWLEYLINTKCEKVSEGFDYIDDFDKNGLALVGKEDGERYSINEDLEYVKYNEDNLMKLYMNGNIDVYDLADEWFEGETLNKIISNERKLYEYYLNFARTEEQKAKVKEDAELRAEYINGKAFELSQGKAKNTTNVTSEKVAVGGEFNLF